jgi:hypothetical protein
MSGERTEVGVRRGGFERDVGGGALVEDLRASHLPLVEGDVVDHQLDIDDRDPDGLAGAGPQGGIADAVDLAADAAVPEHRRLEPVLPIRGSTLCGDIAAAAEQNQRERRRE